MGRKRIIDAVTVSLCCRATEEHAALVKRAVAKAGAESQSAWLRTAILERAAGELGEAPPDLTVYAEPLLERAARASGMSTEAFAEFAIREMAKVALRANESGQHIIGLPEKLGKKTG